MAIELSRSVTFGQYLDLQSPVHRLDPRTKITALLALMLALFLTRSFAGFAVFLAGMVAPQLLSRISLAYVLRGMRLLVYTLAIIFVFQVLFYQSPSGNIGALWRWGILSISVEGAAYALLIVIRVLLLYYLTSMLMFTTGLVDLADGMEVMLNPLKRLRAPVNELVLVFVIALKFVPILITELERLIKAQAARGVSLNQGNLIERARHMGAILVPLFVGAFQKADMLTTAMDARCYRGGQGRTKRRVLTLRRADLAALLYAFALAITSVAVGRLI